MKIVTRLTLPVDYSQAFSSMIGRGRYDQVDSAINPRNFPLRRAGLRETEFILIQFVKPTSPVEAIGFAAAEQLKPAEIEELLSLGSKRPELQRAAPIAALGSGLVMNSRRYVPCLGGGRSVRTLTLTVIYRRWSPYYRFVFIKS